MTSVHYEEPVKTLSLPPKTPPKPHVPPKPQTTTPKHLKMPLKPGKKPPTLPGKPKEMQKQKMPVNLSYNKPVDKDGTISFHSSFYYAPGTKKEKATAESAEEIYSDIQ